MLHQKILKILNYYYLIHDLANDFNLKVNNNEKEICDFLLGKILNQYKLFFSSLCWTSIWSFYYFR